MHFTNVLDFKTIDKLCKNNPDFELFIEQIDKLLRAGDGYHKSTEKEFSEMGVMKKLM